MVSGDRLLEDHGDESSHSSKGRPIYSGKHKDWDPFEVRATAYFDKRGLGDIVLHGLPGRSRE